MRHVSEQGLQLTASFESFRSHRYLCPAGYPTIGYGHVVRPSEDLEEVDRETATELLKRDMRKAERAVSRLIGVPLTQGQYDALCDFTFNVGAGALQRSTLRAKLNRGEYEEVPAELMKWVRGGGRVLRGLVRRRRAEVALFAGYDQILTKAA